MLQAHVIGCTAGRGRSASFGRQWAIVAPVRAQGAVRDGRMQCRQNRMSYTRAVTAWAAGICLTIGPLCSIDRKAVHSD